MIYCCSGTVYWFHKLYEDGSSWASKDVVWSNMLEKDKAYTRDVHMMEKHPHLQPKMRAILLDWLMELSEVYKLHRETYHLAQDYFDRFMATQRNVFKSTLQLIGITCLFIAAKVEEMYPPKVHQFAYVTDEACTEDEILSMEIIIMMELKWSLSPQTPVSWLNVYMQVAYLKETDELLLPRYPQETFTQIAQLLDLCLLDVRCLEFSNGVLAASALFHFSSLELVEAVSALKRAELEECVRWMVPFAMALREVGGASLKSFPGIPEDDVHNIQTHASYMAWLFWMELFADLRDAGYFNGSHEHQRLLRYCFGDVIQKDLDECVGLWNSHRIWPSKTASCPGGVPNELYYLPHRLTPETVDFKLNRLNWMLFLRLP
ncbi:G1/S-specific cyclin-E1-like isoform X1 [Takifugu rubripes]|uniref:G1/S-specific cyclin-E1-like isoform X1 n=1 Tax=Takifugu rubripes TaxID=31033 RepID=UPI001145C462|nr:G1/S-specific cyclin-E1-like isoform X1 [Takifugu rubripes]